MNTPQKTPATLKNELIDLAIRKMSQEEFLELTDVAIQLNTDQEGVVFSALERLASLVIARVNVEAGVDLSQIDPQRITPREHARLNVLMGDALLQIAAEIKREKVENH
jgi:hypothetical protein